MAAELGSQAKYESFRIPYLVPAREAKYTPDFLLLKNHIIVETKGIFDVEDRQKHLLVKEQHPDLDIRFVFQNPNAKLYKGSPTSYAMWCEKNGFLYAKKSVPDAWIKEKPNAKRTAAVKELIENHPCPAKKPT